MLALAGYYSAKESESERLRANNEKIFPKTTQKKKRKKAKQNNFSFLFDVLVFFNYSDSDSDSDSAFNFNSILTINPDSDCHGENMRTL